MNSGLVLVGAQHCCAPLEHHDSFGLADAMREINFARWKVQADPESTRAACAAIANGAPETCGCEPCKNFAAQRSEAYPPQALDLFNSLGIVSNREAEVYHLARLESGNHLYGGWFHFVGAILEGGNAQRQVSENVGSRT
jgi:hypothetical protein